MIPVHEYESFKLKNVYSIDEIVHLVAKYKEQGEKVGLCVGGYDLLHPGHVSHFMRAKELCDYLIVGVTSDAWNSQRKGNGRPIYDEQLRIFMVCQISSVNASFISSFKSAVEVIRIIRPNVYIKGPDYRHKNTPGITAERETILEIGGEMRYTHEEMQVVEKKISTSLIIQYIKDHVS